MARTNKNITLKEIVRQHPILFNALHPDYNDNAKKNEIWRELAQQMNMSCKALKKKWWYFRSCKNLLNKSKLPIQLLPPPAMFAAMAAEKKENKNQRKRLMNLNKDMSKTELMMLDFAESMLKLSERRRILTTVKVTEIVAKTVVESNNKETKANEGEIESHSIYINRTERRDTYVPCPEPCYCLAVDTKIGEDHNWPHEHINYAHNGY